MSSRVILLPVDDDDLSEATLVWALEHAIRPDDVLHLIHVELAEPSAGVNSVPMADYFEQSKPQAQEQAHREMLQRRFLSKLPGAKLTNQPVLHIVKATLDPNAIGKVICEHAASLGAELVVLCSHTAKAQGGTASKAGHIGSVAQYCSQHAPCPVTVVRSRA